MTNPNRLVLFLTAASLVGAGTASAQGVGNNRERREQKQAEKAERRAQQEAEQARRAQERAARQKHEANRAARNAEQQRLEAARAADVQRARVDQARSSSWDRERMIQLQKKRIDAYNQSLAQKAAYAKQREAELRRANRQAQYRYQQEYLRRLEQQRYALSRYNNYNYSNDPYFNTAPSYRYYRGGQYYQVNQYAADQLRTAVNSGYEEGYRAGQADRSDGYRFSYRDSFAFQDANYGYSGMYVDQSEYNHYFREGFERGYQDGYYSRQQFGRVSNGRLNILSTVLNTILALQSLR
jgi:hypothetical protein